MSQKKHLKKVSDPYLVLLRKVLKNLKSYRGEEYEIRDGKVLEYRLKTGKLLSGPSYRVWELGVLRDNYREGLQTILTGLPKDAQKVVDLRFGLTSQRGMSQRQAAQELGMPLSRLKGLERCALFELGQEYCQYFYLVPPHVRDSDETFQKTLQFLRGSGFSAFTMYVMAQVGIHDTEGLQFFVQMCPEFFNIFTDEGCDQLVKMGCEDPRELETLENYLFDDYTRIEAMNFSSKTYEMLVFGNEITTIGMLRILNYEDIVDLKGITKTEVREICEKLVRLSYTRMREELEESWCDMRPEDEMMQDYMDEMMEDFE